MIIYNILLVLLSVVGIGFIALGIFQEKVLEGCLVEYAKTQGALSILTIISILLTERAIRTDIFFSYIGIENIAIIISSIVITFIYISLTYSRNSYRIDVFNTVLGIFSIPILMAVPYVIEFISSKLI